MTGQLGNVMKESAKAARHIVAVVQRFRHAGRFYWKLDIHIHVPAGAMPNGPSAGITIATALASAISGKKSAGI